MKPPPFTYHAPESVTDALRLLSEHGHGAKVLAGGQSLIPLLNMRLAEPEHIVDVNRLPGLDAIAAGGDGVRVGALVRHAELERHAGAKQVQPLLRRALRLVAHPAIRNRGTVVGSLAHADPAAELPAVLALLGGTVELASASGRRTVGADEFFVGPLESAARPDELAVGAHFPALPPGRSGCAFEEVAQRHGDYALAGVAVTVTLDDGLRVTSARAAYVGVGAPPPVLDLTEVTGGRWDPAPPSWHIQGATPENPSGGGAKPGNTFGELRAYVAERVDPEADIHASAEYRRHLAGVLTERALRTAYADAVADR